MTSIAHIAADGLGMEYVRLEAGRLHARWTVLDLPPLVLQFARADNALIRKVRTPLNRWVLIVPLVSVVRARWDGSSIGDDAFVVCPPGTESRGFDPGGAEVALVSMNQKVAATVGAPSGAAASSGIVRTDPAQALTFRQILDRARGAWATQSCEEVFGVLRRALAAARAVTTFGGRPDLVRQAEEFVGHHAGERVSIADLAAVLGVSERSLRNAFYDVYAVSPKRYLMIWQLHQARQALSAPSQTNLTVTDVATQHGFFELGRFAGDYKALFGESPAQTLERARNQVGRRRSKGQAGQIGRAGFRAPPSSAASSLGVTCHVSAHH